MLRADSGPIWDLVFFSLIALAQDGCSFGWAAQVCMRCSDHGKSPPVVAGAPVEVQSDSLPEAFEHRWQLAFDAIPLFGLLGRANENHQAAEVSRFRMGSDMLPVEQGRHMRLPRHMRVCNLCHAGALGDEIC